MLTATAAERGSGPGGKKRGGLRSKDGPAKNFYTKSKTLPFAE